MKMTTRQVLVSVSLFVPSAELVAMLRRNSPLRRPDDLATEYQAFMLDPGMGPATYLTTDGRIVWDDGDIWQVAGTLADAFMAITVGAKKTGIVQLRNLLPQRDAGSAECAQCAGSGWFNLNGRLGDTDGEVFGVVCPACAGLGWMSPAVVLAKSVLEVG